VQEGADAVEQLDALQAVRDLARRVAAAVGELRADAGLG
jgi:hypothetical protein